MYQYSRAIYRELLPLITASGPRSAEVNCRVLAACESNIRRLATDGSYFARPARALFNDVRCYFPMNHQRRVFAIIERYCAYAQEFVARQPLTGFDVDGNPLRCRATTRKGRACQRTPLPRNGYCPSHQHLAESEERLRLAESEERLRLAAVA